MISDIVMPGALDGIDLCEAVADLYPSLKVILSTGYTEKLDDLALLPPNCHELIKKPFRVRQLLDAVDRVNA